MVAFYHVEGSGPLFQSALFRSGFLFVDFFFVLSGFVIAGAYQQRLANGFPLRDFMVLRLGRIYPLHAFILAVFVAQELVFVLFQPEGWSLREPFSGDRSLGMLLLTALLLHGFLEPYPHIWSAQSWSIAVEIWLYLAIATAWGIRGVRAWRAAGLLAAAALIALSWPDLVHWGTPVSYQLMRGICGFGLGVVCWQIWLRWGGWVRTMPTAIATFAECLVVAIICLAISWFPVGFGLIDLIFAAAVLLFAADRGLVSRLLAAPPMVWLGVLSYSIYMVHPLVIGRGADLLRLAGLGELVMSGGVPIRKIAAGPIMSDVLTLALVTASVAAAYFTWRMVEAPSRNWSRRLAARLGAEREERAAPTI
jgi:peptidoglycan/LPS O-acetylase OafA/YrhL